MPVEFRLEPTGSSSDTARLSMMYDGSGRRISKTLLTKPATATSWDTVKVTHYTGIGTEVREEFHNGTREKVNMPVFFRVTLTWLKPRSYIEKDILRLSNGGAILPKQSFGASRQSLGRYGIEDAAIPYSNINSFEWYLKNNLGSTMLVYGLKVASNSEESNVLSMKAAYDYRAFGEQVVLTEPADKVTENFTGKELDDEIALNYFGTRYLDPMLGMWISVDNARQFDSPYLYMGNGTNPAILTDTDGNIVPLAVGVAVAKGAAIGIGTGVAIKTFLACVKHEDLEYTVGDALVDGAFGGFTKASKTGVTDIMQSVGRTALGRGVIEGSKLLLKKGAISAITQGVKKLGKDFVGDILETPILKESAPVPINRGDDSIEMPKFEVPADNTMTE